MSSDLVNGLFELGGAILTCLSVRRLHRDKQVQGFHPAPWAFITLWGYWNCWFYPVNGLWLSFAGGLALASVNTVYLAMLAYYLYVRPWLLVMAGVYEIMGWWFCRPSGNRRD